LPSTAHSMSQMEKSISTTSIGVSIDPTVSGAPSEIAMESGDGGGLGRPKRKRIPTADGAARNAAAGDGRRALHHCNYCHKDVTEEVRVKCAVCVDFELCVECASVGAEATPHKAAHPYRVVDNLRFPLFADDWRADEELLLLEAIEAYGLGNWTEVAEHVGTKSKAMCRTHYFAVYVNVPTAPLPDLANMGRPAPAQAPGGGEEAAHHAPTASPASHNDVNFNANAAAMSARTFQSPAAAASAVESKVGGNSSDITGYHAKRNEFDPEYDNEAELPLADMDFGPSDTPEEVALKSRMLVIYNERLLERARRKQFILERGLLNVKRLQAQERKRTKEEREIHSRFSVFARFHSQAEQDALVEGLVQEQRLRQRIDQLKEYRRNGIHTLQEAEAFELEKRQREAERSRLRALGGQGIKGNIRANRYLMRDGNMSPAVPVYAGTAREVQKLQGGLGLGGGSSNSLGAVGAGSQKTKRVGTPLDIQGLPGTELLSPREQELCAVCRMLPVHYLAVKEALMRKSLKEGHVLRQDARAMFQVDGAKMMRIYDLMLSCSWLREAPPSESGTQCATDAEDGTKEGDTGTPPSISCHNPPCDAGVGALGIEDKPADSGTKDEDSAMGGIPVST